MIYCDIQTEKCGSASWQMHTYISLHVGIQISSRIQVRSKVVEQIHIRLSSRYRTVNGAFIGKFTELMTRNWVADSWINFKILLRVNLVASLGSISWIIPYKRWVVDVERVPARANRPRACRPYSEWSPRINLRFSSGRVHSGLNAHGPGCPRESLR